MENAARIRLPQKPGYGAAEIKDAIRRNTYKGFAYTMVCLALVSCLSFFSGKAESKERIYSGPVTFSPLKQEKEPPKEVTQVKPDIPEPDKTLIEDGGKHGPKEVFSRTILGVDETELDSTLPDIANIDKIDIAGSKPGDGIDGGTDSPPVFNMPQNHGPVEVAETETLAEEPRPDWVVAEVQPTVNHEELKNAIVYPELARKIGKEGRVTLKVWINKDGNPEDVVLLRSDSKLLEEEAQRVVKMPVYTPAVNRGKPVGCWIVIPINFTLTK